MNGLRLVDADAGPDDGALAGTNRYSGNFDGTFYGPAAVETGYTFTLNRRPGGSAAGLFVGKKP